MFYINLFLIYSVIGYFLETISMAAIGKNYNSSVLYGPWTHIYGLACLVMMIIYLLIRKLKLSKKIEVSFFFIFSCLILTLLEGISGYVIELTQHKIYWDYRSLWLNIGNYMSVEIGLIWGILAVLNIYFLLPFISEKIKKIPKAITLVALSLFILDVIISLVF